MVVAHTMGSCLLASNASLAKKWPGLKVLNFRNFADNIIDNILNYLHVKQIWKQKHSVRLHK